jgi:hypothetical protein
VNLLRQRLFVAEANILTSFERSPYSVRNPYRLLDGSIDTKRLPKAIQAILSNYRDVKVSGLDEKAVPDILVRLGRAARSLGKMPDQCGDPAPAYAQLADVLFQLV